VDGLPVGLELLGAAFAEARLLDLAFAWERAATPRRAPFSTPPLVNGAAPAPRTFTVAVPASGAPAPPAAAATSATVRLTYVPTTAQLTFDASAPGGDPVLALVVHRRDGERTGPIVAHLLRHGQKSATGTWTLRGRERDDFVAGRLVLRLYTDRDPLGTAPVPFVLP
jgi:amidase